MKKVLLVLALVAMTGIAAACRCAGRRLAAAPHGATLGLPRASSTTCARKQSRDSQLRPRARRPTMVGKGIAIQDLLRSTRREAEGMQRWMAERSLHIDPEQQHALVPKTRRGRPLVLSLDTRDASGDPRPHERRWTAGLRRFGR